MQVAQSVVAAAAVDPGRVVDRVALDLEGRRRRRHVVETAAGEALLVDLGEAPQLAHGDALRLDGGQLVVVEALPEALMEVTVADPVARVKVAWHLGNRHLPVQFVGEALRLRRDHVIRAMLEGLGATVTDLSAAFDPEAGAYHGGGHEHGHG